PHRPRVRAVGRAGVAAALGRRAAGSARVPVVKRALVASGVAAALAAGAAAAAGPEVDVSRAPGIQAEVSVAVDPIVHSTLVAASNSVVLPLTIRRAGIAVYGSSDGGATWRRSRGPRPAATCVVGDPVVGVDRRRRQYLA